MFLTLSNATNAINRNPRRPGPSGRRPLSSFYSVEGLGREKPNRRIRRRHSNRRGGGRRGYRCVPYPPPQKQRNLWNRRERLVDSASFRRPLPEPGELSEQRQSRNSPRSRWTGLGGYLPPCPTVVMHLQGGDTSNAPAECTSVEALGDCLMFDDIDMPRTRMYKYLEGMYLERIRPQEGLVALGTNEPVCSAADSLVIS